jgi:hypothetical protein
VRPDNIANVTIKYSTPWRHPHINTWRQLISDPIGNKQMIDSVRKAILKDATKNLVGERDDLRRVEMMPLTRKESMYTAAADTQNSPVDYKQRSGALPELFLSTCSKLSFKDPKSSPSGFGGRKIVEPRAGCRSHGRGYPSLYTSAPVDTPTCLKKRLGGNCEPWPSRNDPDRKDIRVWATF